MKPIIRDYCAETDRNWILSTAASIPTPRKCASAYLEYALSSWDVAILGVEEDPTAICAVLIVDGEGAIAWAFTKSPYRRLGLFRRLCEHYGVGNITSYIVHTGEKPWQKIIQKMKLKHNPLAMFR